MPLPACFHCLLTPSTHLVSSHAQLIYLPGIDGSGMAASRQFPGLLQKFDLRTLVTPPAVRRRCAAAAPLLCCAAALPCTPCGGAGGIQPAALPTVCLVCITDPCLPTLHLPLPTTPHQDRTDFRGLVAIVAEFLKAEVPSCPPTRPVYVLGESFGGVLALAVAAECPALVDRLVLVNPATSFKDSLWPTLGPLLPQVGGGAPGGEGLWRPWPRACSCTVM